MNRFIRTWVAIGWACLATGIARAEPRPNVVFILADDLGIMDIAAYAARFTGAAPREIYYQTPHLDRLVSDGLAFSQAYACQLCSPTRASLLTGKNAARLGFTTATPGSVRSYYNQGRTPPPGYLPHDAVYWGDQIEIEQALWNGSTLLALPSGRTLDGERDETTLAEAMTDHQAVFIGKWHVGGHGAAGWQPGDQGFREISYFDAGGSPYFKWARHWNNRRKHHAAMPQEELRIGRTGPQFGHDYLTDELTEHAVRFIEARARQTEPFFLYLCHFAVHSPWQAKADDVADFKGRSTRGWNTQDHPVYAAMVRALDASVGRIREALRQTGQADNTILVFMSDNGGVNWRPDGPTVNSPFKGGKAMLFEGGIRVPLILCWPGRVRGGRWCDVPVHASDLFPTLLDLTGYDLTPYLHGCGIDGRSFKGLLEDPANAKRTYARDTFIWHYPFNVIPPHPDDGLPLTPHSAIRKGDYKLVHDWNGRLWLYNIQRDPVEADELSDQEPERARALFRELHDWLDAHVARKYHPALNPDYEPARAKPGREFIDLRAMILGKDRAIRRAAGDVRLRNGNPVPPPR
jgi:arylsulfatase A-like enzyme